MNVRLQILSVFVASSLCAMTPPVKQTPDLKLGEAAYVSIEDVVPGQMRYSQRNVVIKTNQIRKLQGFSEDDGRVVLNHDNGKSAFPLKMAAPVMKIKDRQGSIKYVLKDAHHDTFSNRALAKRAGVFEKATMPVKVKNDFSSRSYRDFWRHAHKNYLVDLRGVDGKLYLRNPPKSFDDLKDDPVRYFVSISARKGKNGETLEESVGSEYPLWYKRLINVDNPDKYPGDVLNAQMIENVVSQKLIDNGFTYNWDTVGEQGARFNAKVREAHAILSKPKNKIEGLRLVKKLGPYSEIKGQLRELAAQPDPLA